jgi:hypothetical protein
MSEKGFRAAIVRNDIARGIIAGFSAVTPLLSGVWRYIDHALADVSAVLAELEAVRLDRANLLAAMSAALGAWSDGEDDPLWYIRDELESRQMPPEDHGRTS